MAATAQTKSNLPAGSVLSLRGNTRLYRQLILAVAVLYLSTLGCRQKVKFTATPVTLRPTAEQTSPFDEAIRRLNQLDKYQPIQAGQDILNNLRQWSREQRDSVEWIADPMFSRLPSKFKQQFTTDRLSTSEFEDHDAVVLKEAIWLRDLAKSLQRRQLDDVLLTGWLESALSAGKINQDDAADLSLVYRLFDWTVRNVQLDPEIEDIDYFPADLEKRNEDTPRHIYYPWENLLYGHGDWLERARVTILLARQAGIHVVMLIADKGEGLRPEPWAAAAFISGELYLFDPLLGMPLPGADGALIGKLSDYLDDPLLLARLSTPDQPYRITKKDLEKLKIAIDATPAYLSQRMKLVESRLTGDNQVVLTVAPTTLGVQLRTCRGVSGVEIWTHPYEGYEFWRLYGERPLEEKQAFRLPFFQEERPFSSLTDLLKGRLLHFRGYFRGNEDDPGATQCYMKSRPSSEEMRQFDIPLDALPENSPLLAKLPVEPGQRLQVYDALMQDSKSRAIRSKHLATYWLGLLAYETEKYQVAADYFQKRILDVDDDSPWKQGARYNLARAYESIGLRDSDQASMQMAIELYEQSPATPQRAGDLLRAQRLRAQTVEPD